MTINLSGKQSSGLDTTAGDLRYITLTGSNVAVKFNTPYAQTVTVAKSGGDYTTITSALAAITDAATDKRYLIKVMPGTYVEAVTMKAYVDIKGSGWWNTIITQADANVITPTINCQISDVYISITAPTATRSAIITPATLTNFTAQNCFIDVAAGSGGNSRILNFISTTTISDVYFLNCIFKGHLDASNYEIYLCNGATTAVRFIFKDCIGYNLGYGIYNSFNGATATAAVLTLDNCNITATNRSIELRSSLNSTFSVINSYNNTYITGAINLTSNAATRTVTFNSYGDSIASVTKTGSGGTETFNSYGSTVGGVLQNDLGMTTSGTCNAVTFTASGTSPIADETYTVGIGTSTGTNGTITIKGGIIIAIQQAT